MEGELPSAHMAKRNLPRVVFVSNVPEHNTSVGAWLGLQGVVLYPPVLCVPVGRRCIRALPHPV